MEVWPVQHAKARFSELLYACQREGPQVVSRRGIETAVLVPIEEWRRVQARSRPSLKALLLTAEPRIEALAAERGRGRQVQVKVGARAAPACFHQPSARAFHPKPQQQQRRHLAQADQVPAWRPPARSQTNRACFVVALRCQGLAIAAVIAANCSRACGSQTSARSAFTCSPTASCRHGPDHRPLAPRLRATRR